MSEKSEDEIANEAFEQYFKDHGYQYGEDEKANARGWFKAGFKQNVKPHTTGFGCIDGKYHKYKEPLKSAPSKYCLRCGQKRKVY